MYSGHVGTGQAAGVPVIYSTARGYIQCLVGVVCKYNCSRTLIILTAITLETLKKLLKV